MHNNDAILPDNMGMTKYNAVLNKIDNEKYIMPYGKYRGNYLHVIYESDPDYFFWLAQRAEGDLRTAMFYIIEKEAATCLTKRDFQKTRGSSKLLSKLRRSTRKKGSTGI